MMTRRRATPPTTPPTTAPMEESVHNQCMRESEGGGVKWAGWKELYVCHGITYMCTVCTVLPTLLVNLRAIFQCV